MAEFVVNPERHDPYKNFKFRIKWDGRYVAGVSKVSALRRATQVITHREGGDPSSTEVAGANGIRTRHARARRDPRPELRAMGQHGVENGGCVRCGDGAQELP